MVSRGSEREKKRKLKRKTKKRENKVSAQKEAKFQRIPPKYNALRTHNPESKTG